MSDGAPWFKVLPELYDSESIAVTYVTGVGRLHDAEQIALDRIADALSWMKGPSYFTVGQLGRAEGRGGSLDPKPEP